ncbi:MAG: EVE domain-containing protein [Francisellaceae bacterium]|jgi:predicted RNA-binding protein with PUA-like domain|nr:EVE domain-containing protein [Francisellaceae bacterium]MBT6208136.1 EVE domain-containing protein [Francisellaceae bacterium]MBT6539925.1 EVE domain-containing protein [Francisellaceae bacterium]
MTFWLMKSEPDAFGIDDLKKKSKGTDCWDGIRNYQARNFMRDEMKKGDEAFFYHSSCKEPGIYGTMKIVKESYPDLTAFDTNEKYFDVKSSPENPRWFMVDVKFTEKFENPIFLAELRLHKQLASMKILQRGNRLSITPITSPEWNYIIKLAAN